MPTLEEVLSQIKDKSSLNIVPLSKGQALTQEEIQAMNDGITSTIPKDMDSLNIIKDENNNPIVDAEEIQSRHLYNALKTTSNQPSMNTILESVKDFNLNPDSSVDEDMSDKLARYEFPIYADVEDVAEKRAFGEQSNMDAIIKGAKNIVPVAIGVGAQMLGGTMQVANNMLGDDDYDNPITAWGRNYMKNNMNIIYQDPEGKSLSSVKSAIAAGSDILGQFGSAIGSMAAMSPINAGIIRSGVFLGSTLGGPLGGMIGGIAGTIGAAALNAYSEGVIDAAEVYNTKYKELWNKTQNEEESKRVAKLAAKTVADQDMVLNTALNIIPVIWSVKPYGIDKYIKNTLGLPLEESKWFGLQKPYTPGKLATETFDEYADRLAKIKTSGYVNNKQFSLSQNPFEALKNIKSYGSQKLNSIKYNALHPIEYLNRNWDIVGETIGEGLEEYHNYFARQEGLKVNKEEDASSLPSLSNLVKGYADMITKGEGAYDLMAGSIIGGLSSPIMSSVHFGRSKVYNPDTGLMDFKHKRNQLLNWIPFEFAQDHDQKDYENLIVNSLQRISDVKTLGQSYANATTPEDKDKVINQLLLAPLTKYVDDNTFDVFMLSLKAMSENLSTLVGTLDDEQLKTYLNNTDKNAFERIISNLETEQDDKKIKSLNLQLDTFRDKAKKTIGDHTQMLNKRIEFLESANEDYKKVKDDITANYGDQDFGYASALFKNKMAFEIESDILKGAHSNMDKARNNLRNAVKARYQNIKEEQLDYVVGEFIKGNNPNFNDTTLNDLISNFLTAKKALLQSQFRMEKFAQRYNSLSSWGYENEADLKRELELVEQIGNFEMTDDELRALADSDNLSDNERMYLQMLPILKAQLAIGGPDTKEIKDNIDAIENLIKSINPGLNDAYAKYLSFKQLQDELKTLMLKQVSNRADFKGKEYLYKGFIPLQKYLQRNKIISDELHKLSKAKNDWDTINNEIISVYKQYADIYNDAFTEEQAKFQIFTDTFNKLIYNKVIDISSKADLDMWLDKHDTIYGSVKIQLEAVIAKYSQPGFNNPFIVNYVNKILQQMHYQKDVVDQLRQVQYHQSVKLAISSPEELIKSINEGRLTVDDAIDIIKNSNNIPESHKEPLLKVLNNFKTNVNTKETVTDINVNPIYYIDDNGNLIISEEIITIYESKDKELIITKNNTYKPIIGKSKNIKGFTEINDTYVVDMDKIQNNPNYLNGLLKYIVVSNDNKNAESIIKAVNNIDFLSKLYIKLMDSNDDVLLRNILRNINIILGEPNETLDSLRHLSFANDENMSNSAYIILKSDNTQQILLKDIRNKPDGDVFSINTILKNIKNYLYSYTVEPSNTHPYYGIVVRNKKNVKIIDDKIVTLANIRGTTIIDNIDDLNKLRNFINSITNVDKDLTDDAILSLDITDPFEINVFDPKTNTLTKIKFDGDTIKRISEVKTINGKGNIETNEFLFNLVKYKLATEVKKDSRQELRKKVQLKLRNILKLKDTDALPERYEQTNDKNEEVLELIMANKLLDNATFNPHLYLEFKNSNNKFMHNDIMDILKPLYETDILDDTNTVEIVDDADGVIYTIDSVNKMIKDNYLQSNAEPISDLKEGEFYTDVETDNLEKNFDFKKYHINNLDELKKIPFEKFTQDEFAYWLQDNIEQLLIITTPSDAPSGKSPILLTKNSNIIYNLLTLRPENRLKGLLLKLDKLDVKKIRDYKSLFTTKLILEFENHRYDGNWFNLLYGNTKNTEKDGRRRKAYITIEKNNLFKFTDNILDILKQIDVALKAEGYNGSFKTTSSLLRLSESFDNIVIHGANEAEVDKAVKVIQKVLSDNNIKNKFAQKGKDGSLKDGTHSSHTDILAEKVVNNEVEIPKSKDLRIVLDNNKIYYIKNNKLYSVNQQGTISEETVSDISKLKGIRITNSNHNDVLRYYTNTLNPKMFKLISKPTSPILSSSLIDPVTFNSPYIQNNKVTIQKNNGVIEYNGGIINLKGNINHNYDNEYYDYLKTIYITDIPKKPQDKSKEDAEELLKNDKQRRLEEKAKKYDKYIFERDNIGLLNKDSYDKLLAEGFDEDSIYIKSIRHGHKMIGPLKGKGSGDDIKINTIGDLIRYGLVKDEKTIKKLIKTLFEVKSPTNGIILDRIQNFSDLLPYGSIKVYNDMLVYIDRDKPIVTKNNELIYKSHPDKPLEKLDLSTFDVLSNHYTFQLKYIDLEELFNDDELLYNIFKYNYMSISYDANTYAMHFELAKAIINSLENNKKDEFAQRLIDELKTSFTDENNNNTNGFVLYTKNKDDYTVRVYEHNSKNKKSYTNEIFKLSNENGVLKVYKIENDKSLIDEKNLKRGLINGDYKIFMFDKITSKIDQSANFVFDRAGFVRPLIKESGKFVDLVGLRVYINDENHELLFSVITDERNSRRKEYKVDSKLNSELNQYFQDSLKSGTFHNMRYFIPDSKNNNKPIYKSYISLSPYEVFIGYLPGSTEYFKSILDKMDNTFTYDDILFKYYNSTNNVGRIEGVSIKYNDDQDTRLKTFERLLKEINKKELTDVDKIKIIKALFTNFIQYAINNDIELSIKGVAINKSSNIEDVINKIFINSDDLKKQDIKKILNDLIITKINISGDDVKNENDADNNDDGEIPIDEKIIRVTDLVLNTSNAVANSHRETELYTTNIFEDYDYIVDSSVPGSPSVLLNIVVKPNIITKRQNDLFDFLENGINGTSNITISLETSKDVDFKIKGTDVSINDIDDYQKYLGSIFDMLKNNITFLSDEKLLELLYMYDVIIENNEIKEINIKQDIVPTLLKMNDYNSRKQAAISWFTNLNINEQNKFKELARKLFIISRTQMKISLDDDKHIGFIHDLTFMLNPYSSISLHNDKVFRKNEDQLESEIKFITETFNSKIKYFNELKNKNKIAATISFSNDGKLNKINNNNREILALALKDGSYENWQITKTEDNNLFNFALININDDTLVSELYNFKTIDVMSYIMYILIPSINKIYNKEEPAINPLLKLWEHITKLPIKNKDDSDFNFNEYLETYKISSPKKVEYNYMEAIINLYNDVDIFNMVLRKQLDNSIVSLLYKNEYVLEIKNKKGNVKKTKKIQRHQSLFNYLLLSVKNPFNNKLKFYQASNIKLENLGNEQTVYDNTTVIDDDIVEKQDTIKKIKSDLYTYILSKSITLLNSFKDSNPINNFIINEGTPLISINEKINLLRNVFKLKYIKLTDSKLSVNNIFADIIPDLKAYKSDNIASFYYKENVESNTRALYLAVKDNKKITVYKIPLVDGEVFSQYEYNKNDKVANFIENINMNDILTQIIPKVYLVINNSEYLSNTLNKELKKILTTGKYSDLIKYIFDTNINGIQGHYFINPVLQINDIENDITDDTINKPPADSTTSGSNGIDLDNVKNKIIQYLKDNNTIYAEDNILYKLTTTELSKLQEQFIKYLNDNTTYNTNIISSILSKLKTMLEESCN